MALTESIADIKLPVTVSCEHLSSRNECVSTPSKEMVDYCKIALAHLFFSTSYALNLF